MQKQLLERISAVLKTGGSLIYCTCSIAKNEGEAQITAFLESHPDFRLEPLKSERFPEIITPEGFIRTLPCHLTEFGGCDAFFIAKLIKVR